MTGSIILLLLRKNCTDVIVRGKSMRFTNASYNDFIKNKGNRPIIMFGASSAWHYFLKVFPHIIEDVVDNSLCVVDNSVEKQGESFNISGREFIVKNADAMKEENGEYIILITVSLAYHESICEQLIHMDLPDSVECYSLPLMTYSMQQSNNDCVDRYFQMNTHPVNVPKIHSFWFSGEEKPELYKRCLDSWYKYCPEFEIIEWNTGNYDVTKNQYMKEAFENRKWAFVSDYARLDVIYQYGGIYLDMDVELVDSLTKLLNAESFFCRQEDGLLELGSGFGAKAGDPFIKDMLDTYTNRKLILDDGRIDMTPQPEWLSNIMEKYGFYKCHDSQIIGNRLVLSNDYITCSTGSGSTDKAKLGIHWHNGGWMNEKDRKLIRDSFAAKDAVIKKYFSKCED